MASSWALRLISRRWSFAIDRSSKQRFANDQRLATNDPFTSNHRVPQPAPSSLLRSGNVSLPTLRRKRDPAALEWPADEPVPAMPETCRPAPDATAHSAASASGESAGLRAPAAGADT